MKLHTGGRRHLPLPTGPYDVGCCDVMTGHTKSGAFFRLFYPVQKSQAKELCVQWPLWIPSKQYADGCAKRAGILPRLFRKLFSLFVGDVFIPARWQATIAQNGEVFPVIVFSHGLGAWRNAYSSICTQMASRGMVVAVVEHRDYSASTSYYFKQARMSWHGELPGAFLDDFNELLLNWSESEWKEAVEGEWSPKTAPQKVGPPSQKKEWIFYKDVEDDSYIRRQQLYERVYECRQACEVLRSLNEGTFEKNVVDPHFRAEMFRYRLDMNNIAVMGHSFGGATAILALDKEPKFRIGIALDPWMLPFQTKSSALTGIQKPLLVVITDGFQTTKDLAIMKRLQETRTKHTFLKIRKSNHRDQSDIPFIGCPYFPLLYKASCRKSGLRTTNLTVEVAMEMIAKHFGVTIPEDHTNTILRTYVEDIEF